MQMPVEVEELGSFLELLSWAVGVWADHDGAGNFASVVAADTGRSKEVGAEPVDYCGLPSMVHAQWFLRMGAAEVTDWKQARRVYNPAAYNKGSRVNRWVQGGSLTDLEAFCDAAHIEAGVREYLESRHGAFKRQAGDFPVHFSAARVARAIQATHAASGTTAGPVIARALTKLLEQPADGADQQRLIPPTADRETIGSRDNRAAPAVERTRWSLSPDLVLSGRGVHPRLARGRLSLGASESPAGATFVGTSGSVIAAQKNGNLHVARVNRASGVAAPWQTPLELSKLGEGTVLAVDSNGQADIAFVWSGCEGTAIYRGYRADGSVEVIATLDEERALGAVLHGGRTLLLFPDYETAGGSCDAFRDLIVTSLVGAASAGRLVVLAIGIESNGNDTAWIEVDGRYRQSVSADARLELPLGARSFPILRCANGDAVEVSPEPTRGQPYEHWVSPFLIGHAATA